MVTRYYCCGFFAYFIILDDADQSVDNPKKRRLGEYVHVCVHCIVVRNKLKLCMGLVCSINN